MANGSKNRFHQNRRSTHQWSNDSGDRKRMLDMRREKYFQFDLDDLLTEFKLGENKNTIAATILNKASSKSTDDAIEYITRLKAGGTFGDKEAERLETLLLRYSKRR